MRKECGGYSGLEDCFGIAIEDSEREEAIYQDFMGVKVDFVPVYTRSDHCFAFLDQCERYLIMSGFTHLLHSHYQLVYLSCPIGEPPTIPNWDRPSDVRSVVLPFATCVDEQNLRVERFVVKRSRGCGVIMVRD